MGTNYYLKTKYCHSCKRYAIKVHIGKQSVGWKFLFHVTEDIRSADDWFREIDKCDGVISDEYGRQFSMDEFKEIVRKNIFEKSLKTHYGMKDTVCHIDGSYDYMYGDFD